MRSEYSYSELDVDSKSMIQMDLCGYLRDRLNAYAITHTESPTPEFDKLCAVVFSIPQTSSFVESLFSKMVYNQSKIRNRLADKKMTSILHLHDSALPDPLKCLPSTTVLKVMVPRSLRDKITMNKNVGQVVCCVFDDKRYRGEVTEVKFHEIHPQYMYHVVYSDGDSCDYWSNVHVIYVRSTDSDCD